MQVSWHRTEEAAEKAAEKLRRNYRHDSYSVVSYPTASRHVVWRGFTCHCRVCRIRAAVREYVES
jgi:hypothetical protein